MRAAFRSELTDIEQAFLQVPHHDQFKEAFLRIGKKRAFGIQSKRIRQSLCTKKSIGTRLYGTLFEDGRRV